MNQEERLQKALARLVADRQAIVGALLVAGSHNLALRTRHDIENIEAWSVEKDGRILELESSLARAHRMLVADLDALFPLSHEEAAQAKRALLDAVKDYVEDL